MGSSNKASKAAEREEAKRKAEITAAQKRVEAIFGSDARKSQIEDFVGSTRDYFQGELDRQHTDTSRDLKFSLARSGVAGGSIDADKNSRLAQDYLKNVLGIERKAMGAGENLRAQDQNTKLSLFQQILGGMDATTAANQASYGMQNNIGLAKSDALMTTIGNMFGGFADINKSSKAEAGDRRARADFNALYGRQNDPAPIDMSIYG